VDDLETLLDARRGSSGTANLSAKEFKELLNKITGDKVISRRCDLRHFAGSRSDLLTKNLAVFANLNFKVVTLCVINKTKFH
jgi:hypothetical protein